VPDALAAVRASATRGAAAEPAASPIRDRDRDVTKNGGSPGP